MYSYKKTVILNKKKLYKKQRNTNLLFSLHIYISFHCFLFFFNRIYWLYSVHARLKEKNWWHADFVYKTRYVIKKKSCLRDGMLLLYLNDMFKRRLFNVMDIRWTLKQHCILRYGILLLYLNDMFKRRRLFNSIDVKIM